MPEELIKSLSTIFIVMTIFSFINYIVVSLALYKIAKKEKLDKPWLSWIPVGNAYILITLGKGNIGFVFTLVVAMFSRGLIADIAMTLYTVYSVYMYFKICKKYNVSIIPIAIGASSLVVSIIPFLSMLVIPMYLINLYGQWKLLKAADNEVVGNKKNIKTKISLSNGR
ncbi:hypothetical protein [Clostridium sp. Ade.TY]|uniref:hypothetical protein n=1 Tax=Clostridium sp. Ade.TY TaxID=1391647 RepID=UPI0004124EAB|nr:hypothetical protein [Clostridium sp. Ade.TY]